VAIAEAYLHTKWNIDPSSRLATTDMGRKFGVLCHFLRGSWVPIQHNVAWAEAYPRTKWHLDPCNRLATIHGPKLEGCCVPSPFWGRAGSPSNTMWPGPRPTSIPSGIVNHLAIGHNRHGPKIGGLLCPLLG